MYKLGVKRLFWFGYKWYSAVAHSTEVIGNTARLVVTCSDGMKIAIPHIHNRTVCTYSEYRKPQNPEG